MTKILTVCGSPRKGNTEFMLKTVLNEITNQEQNSQKKQLENY